MAAYYVKINGKNYDKKLIDQAKSLSSGKGDGRLSLNDAKSILKTVKDSDDYTDIEKTTISYIRDNFKFTKESDVWFRTEIRRWAALKSTSRKKTQPKKAAPVKKPAEPVKKAVIKKAEPAKKAAVKKAAPAKKAAVKKSVPVKKPAVKKAAPAKKAAVKKTSPAKKKPVYKKSISAAPVKKEPQRDFMAEIISQGSSEPAKVAAKPEKSSFPKAVWVIIILLAVSLGVYLLFPNLITNITNKMKPEKQVAVEEKQIKKAEEKKAEPVKAIEEKAKLEPVKKEIIPVKKIEPKQEDLTGYYIVKEKDSLIDIAVKEYGDYNKWKDIYDLNVKEIIKPSLIFTGQKLKMPKK